MGWSSISGKAKTNPRSPRAFAVCDRCGDWRNREELVFQYQWQGPNLTNTWLLVCPNKCLDIPAQFGRPLYLPPDPPPVWQPRTENFAVDEAGGGDFSYVPTPIPSPVFTWDGGFDLDQGLNWDDGITPPEEWDSGVWDDAGEWL